MYLEIATREYIEILHQEAIRARLVRQVRQAQRRPSTYQRLLVWLGQRFSTWGERLQRRYSVIAPVDIEYVCVCETAR